MCMKSLCTQKVHRTYETPCLFITKGWDGGSEITLKKVSSTLMASYGGLDLLFDFLSH